MSRKQRTIERHKIDRAKPPALTAKQRAELEALAAMRESEVDTSDVPTLPGEAWEHAQPGRFYKPLKDSTTVRIDADVLAGVGLPDQDQRDLAARDTTGTAEVSDDLAALTRAGASSASESGPNSIPQNSDVSVCIRLCGFAGQIKTE